MMNNIIQNKNFFFFYYIINMTDYDVTKQCGQMWDKAATKQIEKKIFV